MTLATRLIGGAGMACVPKIQTRIIGLSCAPETSVRTVTTVAPPLQTEIRATPSAPIMKPGNRQEAVMADHAGIPNPARRTFLGSIAGVAALLPITACLAKGTPSKSTEVAAPPTTGGYRLTAHVRSYYRSTAALYP
jgi:hypothetical protein